MTSKKWSIGFLLISAVTLTLFATVMFITDPLIQYGKENHIFSYYEYSKLYSNPGIAKNYDYDAVMVGTSMIENTSVSECNDAFGCNMVRLPYSGGTAYNMKTILDVCFKSDNNIKTVFWELDDFQLFSAHDAPNHPLPTYLYRDDHLEDASYLLNFDIFYHYNVNNLIGTIKGEEQMVAREEESFSGDFSKKGMLSTYTRPEVSEEVLPSDFYLEQVELNLNTNILPLIEENPDTEFVFFTVPFSMLYWDNALRTGNFDATLTGMEYALSKLLEYDNVSIYFYHDEWDIATNLDNYKDYSHYGKWINSYMVQQMAKDSGRLTKENCESVFEDMKNFVCSYDYDAIFD